jgi:acyl-CoA-binding protein
MAASASLEEKFNAAVKAIQRLPSDGTFQPSNEMKLTFYGLYKQATVGPCKEPRPSMFYYIDRTKWDAWDKCRSMSKEAAMAAYIDELRKILETMPQTNEVLKFTQLIGPFYEFVDDRTEQNGTVSLPKKKSNKKKLNSFVNGDDHDEQHPVSHTNGPIRTLVSAGNGPGPSSSPSSSSSSIPSSDVDEFFDDPSDRLPLNHNLPNDEITSNNINPDNQPLTVSNIPQPNHHHRHHPHVYGGQDGTNVPVHRSNRGGNHSHEFHGSAPHSSYRHHDPSDGVRYSFSSVASGGGGSGRHPNNNNYNKETQRAILTALTKLQRDVNNILERLNRLETSTHFLQQRESPTQLHCSPPGMNSLSRWLPLSGLRRRAITFILLWPFFVFALIRLFLRARIIIRFRQPRL